MELRLLLEFYLGQKGLKQMPSVWILTCIHLWDTNFSGSRKEKKSQPPAVPHAKLIKEKNRGCFEN